MAEITTEDLDELKRLITGFKSALHDSKRAASGLTLRHPIFRDRTIDIPVAGVDRQQINNRKNQAETALVTKMKALTT